jgi:DNA-binding response OmpR family regulator
MSAILIIEDDPDTQIILRDYLTTLSPDVRVAASAAEARHLAAESTPTLMLIDIGLPDADGVSLLADFRAQDEFGDTRTIGMTAYADTPTRERVLSAGFDDVLWKPVDGQDLLRAVRRQLNTPGEGARAGGQADA